VSWGYRGTNDNRAGSARKWEKEEEVTAVSLVTAGYSAKLGTKLAFAEITLTDHGSCVKQNEDIRP
jgi:hypothetical protein